MSKKKKKILDEGMIMISSLMPTIGPKPTLSMRGNKKDNFEFKGLPGQFNEQGEKVRDEYGQPIDELKEDFNSKVYDKEDAKEMVQKLESALDEFKYQIMKMQGMSKSSHKQLTKGYALCLKAVQHLEKDAGI